jgi:hypothetical protein
MMATPIANGGTLIGYIGGACPDCGGIILGPVFLYSTEHIEVTHFPGWPPDTPTEKHYCPGTN